MKNAILVMIAALTLAACGGNKGKSATSNACQPGVGSCSVNQAIYPVQPPQVGVPGHYGGNYAGNHAPIVGSYCSDDSRIRFDQDGAVSVTNLNGGFYFGRYTSGALIIDGNVMPVKLTPASPNSPALLYVMVSPGATEIMEQCDQYQDQDDDDDKDEDDEDSKPKPSPKPKPYPKPKPQPTPLPEPPKAT